MLALLIGSVSSLPFFRRGATPLLSLFLCFMYVQNLFGRECQCTSSLFSGVTISSIYFQYVCLDFLCMVCLRCLNFLVSYGWFDFFFFLYALFRISDFNSWVIHGSLSFLLNTLCGMCLLTLASMSSFEDVPELVDIGSISTFLLYFSM